MDMLHAKLLSVATEWMGWMQLHMLPHLAGPQFSLVTGAAKSCIVRLGRLIPLALDNRT